MTLDPKAVVQKIRIGDDDRLEVLRACLDMRCFVLHALRGCGEQRAVATLDDDSQGLSFLRRKIFIGLQQGGRRLSEEIARQQVGFVAGAHEGNDADGVGFFLRFFGGGRSFFFDRACAGENERRDRARRSSVGERLFGQLQPREMGYGFDLLGGACVDEHGVARIGDDIRGDGKSPSFEQRKLVRCEGNRDVEAGATRRRGAFVVRIEEQQGFPALQHVLVERVHKFFVLDARMEKNDEVGFLCVEVFGDEEGVDVEVGFDGLEGAPNVSSCSCCRAVSS